MEKPDVLNFKVGQLAEIKTFEQGFRGAWFRCKIRDVCLKKNEIKPEYYDYPEEDITWAKIYERPHYGKESKHIKKQLMFRPHYPPMYHKSEMPPVNSISEVCVIIDGTWKVGDVVDWYEDHCYWCARVIKVLSHDKFQIELPMAPAGEGGTHIALSKDLRPSLDWSARKGWTVATMEGQSTCSAWLIFPSQQDSELGDVQNASASPLNGSSTSRMSGSSLTAPTDQDTEKQISQQQRRTPANMINSEESLQSQEVKMEDEVVESVTEKASSSDSISTLRVQESKTDDDSENLDYNLDLNIMHEDTLEATILDLNVLGYV